MLNNPDWQQISTQIESVIDHPISSTNIQSVSGGCINKAYLLQNKHTHYFIKLNQAHLLPMFEAEFSGLKEIAQTQTIKVPQAILYGKTTKHSFLLLEAITMTAGNSQSDQTLGHQLAALHRTKQTDFGWHCNNTIGSTAQINEPSNNWVTFWRNNRLGYQLSLAEKNGYGGKLIHAGEKLSDKLDYFFSDYSPQPSLVHGDLWSGNAAVCKNGEPIIYDPACYYGDRETDIAMTELFGGFSSHFYNAYNDAYTLHSDYSLRKPLYNLYHILNHLNLFGSGYQSQAQNMIDALLAEVS